MDDPALEEMRERVQLLTPYAVEYRYPGVSATVKEAEDALLRTKEIRAFIRKKLAVYGIDS